MVRGRDLAATTATQVALQRLLGIATPRYRHHLLLLERRGEKLAKLHGAVGFAELRAVYSAPALCGVLARAAGLRPSADPVTPRELLDEFAWSRVRTEDRVLHWTERAGRLMADALASCFPALLHPHERSRAADRELGAPNRDGRHS